jgi:hypothetical protein
MPTSRAGTRNREECATCCRPWPSGLIGWELCFGAGDPASPGDHDGLKLDEDQVAVRGVPGVVVLVYAVDTGLRQPPYVAAVGAARGNPRRGALVVGGIAHAARLARRRFNIVSWHISARRVASTPGRRDTTSRGLGWALARFSGSSGRWRSGVTMRWYQSADRGSGRCSPCCYATPNGSSPAIS